MTVSSDELIGERGRDEELDGGAVFGHSRSGELRAQKAKGGKGRGDGAHRAAQGGPWKLSAVETTNRWWRFAVSEDADKGGNGAAGLSGSN